MAVLANATIKKVRFLVGGSEAAVTLHTDEPPPDGADTAWTVPAKPDGDRFLAAMGDGLKVDADTSTGTYEFHK